MSPGADDFTDVPITEWERFGDLFESFCRGHLDVSEDELTCRSGGASVTVTREGHLEARMPLHECSIDGVDRVGVDVEEGSLVVETESVRYEFTQP